MVRRNTLGTSAIAAAITFAVASLEPARTGAADLWANRKAVSDEQLDNMRGGFEAPNGLQISFGIERAVFVNGELVAATRLVVANLPNLLKGGAASKQALANAFTVVQNGPNNSVENQPAPASVAASPSAAAVPTPSTSTPATVSAAPVAAPMPPSAVTSATGAPSTSAAVSAAPATSSAAASAGAPSTSAAAVSAAPVGATTSSTTASAGANAAASSGGVQSVQFNGQTMVLPNPTAIVTAVQNTLNNQVIQTRTSIDATLNSLSFLRSGAFADALRQQTLLSVRR